MHQSKKRDDSIYLNTCTSTWAAQEDESNAWFLLSCGLVAVVSVLRPPHFKTKVVPASRGRFAGFDLVKWKRIFVDGIASQPVKRNKLAIILNWFLTVRSFSDVSENYFPLFTFHFPLFIFHFHFHFPFSTFHFWIFTFHFSLFTFHKNFRIFLELDIWKNRCISLLLLL